MLEMTSPLCARCFSINIYKKNTNFFVCGVIEGERWAKVTLLALCCCLFMIICLFHTSSIMLLMVIDLFYGICEACDEWCAIHTDMSKLCKISSLSTQETGYIESNYVFEIDFKFSMNREWASLFFSSTTKLKVVLCCVTTTTLHANCKYIQTSKLNEASFRRRASIRGRMLSL